MSKWSNILVASRSAGIPTAPVASPVPPELMTGATWVGRGDDRFDSSGVQYWNNRVSGGTDLITQPSASFRPTAITDALGGTPGTVDGAHFGSGASLDGWEATNVSSLIGLSTWHIFALVKFDSTDYAADFTGFSTIFASANSTTLGSWGTTFLLAVSRPAVSSPPNVTGYVLTGGVNHSLAVPLTLGVPTLIEWWGDGSVMYLRVNGDKPVTKAYAGTINQHATLAARVGSVNYEGGWDDSNNRLYELAIANTKNDDVAGVRTYFAERYNVEVLPVVDTTAADFLPDTIFDNWWHSETGTSGATVETWTDRIGGLDFYSDSPGESPAMSVEAAYGGRSLVRFDGVDDALVLSPGFDLLGAAPVGIVNGNRWSVWWVGNQLAGAMTAPYGIWGSHFTGDAGGITRTYATTNGSTALINQFTGVGYVPDATGTPRSFMITVDGLTVSGYKDGVLLWTGSMHVNKNGTAVQFELGRLVSACAPYQFADFGVRRGVALTLVDAVALHAYAQAKYGIA